MFVFDVLGEKTFTLNETKKLVYSLPYTIKHQNNGKLPTKFRVKSKTDNDWNILTFVFVCSNFVS